MSESGPPLSIAAPAALSKDVRGPVPVPAAPPMRRGFGVGFLLVVPALLLALTTPNTGVTIAAVLSLAIIVRLLWQPGHPPALLLIAGLQWVQGSLMALDANTRGVELRQLSYARSIDEASYLTLAWVTALAFGAWLAIRKLGPDEVASTTAVPISMRRLLIVYGAWALIVEAIAQLGIGGLHQVLIALSTMRWALSFAIFAYGWSRPALRPIALLVLVFDVATGFLSFFSRFRIPLYLFTVALATVGYRPRLRTWFGVSIMFAISLYLGAIWSAIKMDYRDRLSGGEGVRTQIVRIGVEERVDEFIELVGTVDSALLSEGFEMLIYRLSYVHYFAYVLDYVPAVVDHERGALWGGAVGHVLLPRLFFPDKPALEEDTAIAERYTGLNLGAGSGTSIAIGTAAESYVDFGRPGVIVIGFLYGLVVALGYRYFIVKRQWGALAQGAAVSICMRFATLELAASKAFGAFVAVFIISVIGWRFLAPQLLRWLSRA